MVILLVCFGLVAVLVWAGRRPAHAGKAVRMGSGLLSALVAVGAVVSGLRGLWMISLGLVALSAYLAQRSRPARAASGALAGGGMRRSEARAILGVQESASRAEIEAAYRRLIRFAHPDRGGSAGLAAQLNAARDVLAKG